MFKMRVRSDGSVWVNIGLDRWFQLNWGPDQCHEDIPLLKQGLIYREMADEHFRGQFFQ